MRVAGKEPGRRQLARDTHTCAIWLQPLGLGCGAHWRRHGLPGRHSRGGPRAPARKRRGNEGRRVFGSGSPAAACYRPINTARSLNRSPQPQTVASVPYARAPLLASVPIGRLELLQQLRLQHHHVEHRGGQQLPAGHSAPRLGRRQRRRLQVGAHGWKGAWMLGQRGSDGREGGSGHKPAAGPRWRSGRMHGTHSRASRN